MIYDFTYLTKYDTNVQRFIKFTNSTLFNPRKAGFFLRRQRPGGGGFHRKSSNIAIGQFNALKSWPYTSKFTYDHPEQIETIFKSIGGFGKFWGAVEHVRSKIQILSDF